MSTGSIIYDGNGTPQSGPATADNGLSIDSGTSAIVLGQDVGDPANPAIFLNNRELNLNAFVLSFIQEVLTGAPNMLFFNPTWNTVGSPTVLGMDVDNVSATSGFLANWKTNSQDRFQVTERGEAFFWGPNGSVTGIFQTPNPNTANFVAFSVGNTYQHNDASQVSITGISYNGGITDNGTGPASYFMLAMSLQADITNVNAMWWGTRYTTTPFTGLGDVTPDRHIAYENHYGHVLLCSDATSAASNASVRIGGGRGVAPTARLHLALGTAAVNRAPFKYEAGVLAQTVVEDGAKNFDGLNESLAVNGVTYIMAKTLTATGVLDFPNTAAGTSSDLTINVPGAAGGDCVALGVPIAAFVANGCYSAFVTAANVVTVRYTNNSLVTAIDPGSGTFRVSIIKY